MNDQSKLLPCPFCGRNDLVIREDKSEDGDSTITYAYYVFCRDCHCHGRNNYPIGWCESEQAAIEAWNDRFIPVTVPGENDRLMVSSTAMLHIHGELDRIVNMTDHIHDLLTPIQLSITEYEPVVITPTMKKVKLKIKNVSRNSPVIKDELQLAYEAGLRDGTSIARENILAVKEM
jgi:Lar family restriction alleviation protein